MSGEYATLRGALVAARGVRSQREWARQLGVSQSRVWRLEDQGFCPYAWEISEVARLSGVPLEVLLELAVAEHAPRAKPAPVPLEQLPLFEPARDLEISPTGDP